MRLDVRASHRQGGEADVSNRASDRAEIEKLSGQRAVPILVLDDGEVVTGSGRIVAWAKDRAD
jgi:glutathione S-transferase